MYICVTDTKNLRWGMIEETFLQIPNSRIHFVHLDLHYCNLYQVGRIFYFNHVSVFNLIH